MANIQGSRAIFTGCGHNVLKGEVDCPRCGDELRAEVARLEEELEYRTEQHSKHLGGVYRQRDAVIERGVDAYNLAWNNIILAGVLNSALRRVGADAAEQRALAEELAGELSKWPPFSFYTETLVGHILAPAEAQREGDDDEDCPRHGGDPDGICRRQARRGAD